MHPEAHFEVYVPFILGPHFNLSLQNFATLLNKKKQ